MDPTLLAEANERLPILFRLGDESVLVSVFIPASAQEDDFEENPEEIIDDRETTEVPMVPMN